MSENNVVFLAFRNPEKTADETTHVVCCKHCRNKNFLLLAPAENDYPVLKCAACGANIGRVGWVHE